MSYLLDSNAWIGLIRGSSLALARRFRTIAPTAEIRVCSVVCAELWYGCARSAKAGALQPDSTGLKTPSLARALARRGAAG
jgi:predicted nucleic acid-binding protein